ncbi:hypothetical protein [Candidatus Nitrospira salsa]|nr:MAG: hypothetical protein NPIRA01_08750 [Nitrospirales bacterium]
MNNLCLGAAGFIGAHLTSRLLSKDPSVVAGDFYSESLHKFFTILD